MHPTLHLCARKPVDESFFHWMVTIKVYDFSLSMNFWSLADLKISSHKSCLALISCSEIWLTKGLRKATSGELDVTAITENIPHWSKSLAWGVQASLSYLQYESISWATCKNAVEISPYRYHNQAKIDTAADCNKLHTMRKNNCPQRHKDCNNPFLYPLSGKWHSRKTASHFTIEWRPIIERRMKHHSQSSFVVANMQHQVWSRSVAPHTCIQSACPQHTDIQSSYYTHADYVIYGYVTPCRLIHVVSRIENMAAFCLSLDSIHGRWQCGSLPLARTNET